MSEGNTPVLFVHGNGSGSGDWDPMVDHLLLTSDYAADELWTVDFTASTASHEEMARSLQTAANAVLDKTGSDEVDIVAHSLGVTGVRWWVYNAGADDIVRRFVAIAGANHGLPGATYAARMGVDYGPLSVSQFLRSDYETIEGHPLSKLNEDETFGDIEYFTIRGARDSLYAMNPESPVLEGAEENAVVDATHTGIIEDETTFDLVTWWLE